MSWQGAAPLAGQEFPHSETTPKTMDFREDAREDDPDQVFLNS